MKKKSFKNNDAYFKFYNEMKGKIKIWTVKITDKIKITYEVNYER